MTENDPKTDQPAGEEDATAHIEVITPVIAEMGKLKRKKLKALKRGEGPLMEEVLRLLEEVAAEMGEEAENKTFVPVVMTYELKPKRKKRTIVLPF